MSRIAHITASLVIAIAATAAQATVIPVRNISVDGNLTDWGINLLNNNGHAADQSQFHIHLHLIPRYGGDRLLHPWERTFGSRAEMSALAERLRFP